jgi:quinol monooxygenase YgiN/mannose-6-phosphate isomerase-like protein (cupin superfamily)
MSEVARYGKVTAVEGRGEELAERLLAAAEALEDDPGCLLYLVNRQADRPEVVWVSELWRSAEDLEASIERIPPEQAAAVKELAVEWETVELEPLGGKGPVSADDAGSPFTLRKLTDAEDMAAKFGYGEVGEARFLNQDLEAHATGLSHHRLRPNARQAFAHRHKVAEEVYVVVSGSGRANLDGEIVELGELDALRLAPGVTRALEAGPDGMEVLAFGPRHKGDAEMLPGWWEE